MSRKTSDVFRTSFLTMDGTFDPNNSQLFFRPLQAPLNTTDNSFYSLGAAQSNDPSLRINKYSSNGQLNSFGYLYDTQINPPPPAKFIIVAGGLAPNTLVYSQDRTLWAVSPNGSSFLTTSCLAIAYDGFTWVAGGIGTRNVVYSSNGTTWYPSDAGNNPDISAASDILSVQCSAIATNGDFWIAGGIGSNNYCGLCFSYDLIGWYNTSANIQSIFLQGTVSSIAYNGSLWLAGGSNVIGSMSSALASSNDGIYWTDLSSTIAPILNECYALCWNGSFWLAGGNYSGAGRILYSIDGNAWSIANLNGSVTTSVRSIAWNGTVLVAGGYDANSTSDTLGYSYDGINWSPTTSDIFPSLCSGITWDGITWQAVGQGGIATSSDGITWTLNAQGSAILPQGKAIAINKILPLVAPKAPLPDPTSPLTLVGGLDSITGCTIAYSTDGITWTSSQQVASVFGNAYMYALSWNGRLWVGGFERQAGTDYPTVGYSYNGITWNSSTTGTAIMPRRVFSVAYGNYSGTMSFLAIGNDNSDATRLMRSSNGITWTDITASLPLNFSVSQNALQYNGSIWLLVGRNAGTIYYSSDGVTWTQSASGSAIITTVCRSSAWNGRIWCAVGQSGGFSGNTRVAYSSDGINWTQGTLTYSPSDCLCIAWNGSLFVMAGVQTFGYSYDGITWYPADYVSVQYSYTIQSVTWTGTLWVATGYEVNGIILYSYNGTTWYNSSNGSLVLSNQGIVVASNRANPSAGNTLPPSVLNQGLTVPNGYGICTSNANNLYKSSMLYMNEASGVLGINQITRSYSDLVSSPIQAALEISGGGITVNTNRSDAIPGLYLTANNVAAGSGGRIELYDAVNNYGWRIDNNVGGFNRLKIQSKGTGSLSDVMDMRNDSQTIGIGTIAVGATRLRVGGNVLVTGNFSAASKSFLIDHPDPALKDTHKLRHCCVEGPSRGDTLNRWILVTSNKSCVQVLPRYSVHLNEHWQFFVSAKDSFDTGYVILSEDETFFTLYASDDGTYSVVGVATRKDRGALSFDEKGVELLKE